MALRSLRAGLGDHASVDDCHSCCVGARLVGDESHTAADPFTEQLHILGIWNHVPTPFLEHLRANWVWPRSAGVEARLAVAEVNLAKVIDNDRFVFNTRCKRSCRLRRPQPWSDE